MVIYGHERVKDRDYGSENGSVTGACNMVMEPQVSHNAEKFLNCLRNYQLLKKDAKNIQ
jgi:hypothetical protein